MSRCHKAFKLRIWHFLSNRIAIPVGDDGVLFCFLDIAGLMILKRESGHRGSQLAKIRSGQTGACD